ncbi:MAG: hypothetical protein AAGB07_01740, partial [Pseudomonadota bacterium]
MRSLGCALLEDRGGARPRARKLLSDFQHACDGFCFSDSQQQSGRWVTGMQIAMPQTRDRP